MFRSGHLGLRRSCALRTTHGNGAGREVATLGQWLSLYQRRADGSLIPQRNSRFDGCARIVHGVGVRRHDSGSFGTVTYEESITTCSSSHAYMTSVMVLATVTGVGSVTCSNKEVTRNDG
jgi:hypothetical protein